MMNIWTVERKPPELDENHWSTLQELMNAVGEIPGVWERVEAYMIGRDIENPKAEMEALRKVAFA